MLSCECDFDTDGYDLWWEDHSNFKLMGYRFPKRKRCVSCSELINVTEDVLEFYHYRHPNSDIEERIHNEQVPLASRFMCEDCSGQFLALTDLGYCVDIYEPMRDTVEEYNNIRLELLQEKSNDN